MDHDLQKLKRAAERAGYQVLLVPPIYDNKDICERNREQLMLCIAAHNLARRKLIAACDHVKLVASGKKYPPRVCKRCGMGDG
jgi:hypothetical protein